MNKEKREKKNQCDGCQRGLPIKDGAHYRIGGFIDTYCTADRYLPNQEQPKDDIDTMVRDFCSVVPKSKSEVRATLEQMESKAHLKGKSEAIRETYKQFCKTSWGQYNPFATIDDVAKSLGLNLSALEEK